MGQWQSYCEQQHHDLEHGDNDQEEEMITNIREVVATGCAKLRSNEEGFTALDLRELVPSLNDAEMNALTSALSVNTHVEVLWIDVCLHSAPPDAAFCIFIERLLSSHPSLNCVDLSGNQLNATHAAWIGEALKTNSSLARLDLSTNDIDIQGAQSLAEGLRHNTTLEQLDLYDNSIDIGGCRAIATALAASGLKHLSLGLNGLGLDFETNDCETIELAELICNRNCLENISFSHNHIRDDGCRAIATALEGTKSLYMLDLKCNSIAAAGASALGAAIKTNASLNYLILSGNQIGDEGAQYLADGLFRNRTIAHLELCDSKIGLSGCRAIASSLGTCCLVFLTLAANGIDCGGATALTNGISKSKTLTNICLHDNYISDAGCRAIATALGCTSTLRNLSLQRNRVTEPGAVALEVALQHVNYSLEMLNLDNNDGVSQLQRDRIDRLGNNNRNLNDAFVDWKNEFQSLPLGLMPFALGRFESKPDLLYSMIKTNPVVIRERPNRRRPLH